MLKDINLGRYYQTSSFLHSLDPRTKLAFLIIYIVCVFLAETILQCALVLLVLCALIALSRVPLAFMFRGLRTLLIVLIVVDILNILFLDDGLRFSILLSLRMIEVVFASNLLTLTTRPREISDGLEKGLRWLKVFKVPVHDLATMIAVAFRFIPVLTQEARDLMDAQKMRGASFSEGNLIRRAKALGPLTITVFATAFRRADELSLAMDSRFYNHSPNPGKLNPLKYTYRDAASYVAILTFLAVTILMKAGGL